MWLWVGKECRRLGGVERSRWGSRRSTCLISNEGLDLISSLNEKIGGDPSKSLQADQGLRKRVGWLMGNGCNWEGTTEIVGCYVLSSPRHLSFFLSNVGLATIGIVYHNKQIVLSTCKLFWYWQSPPVEKLKPPSPGPTIIRDIPFYCRTLTSCCIFSWTKVPLRTHLKFEFSILHLKWLCKSKLNYTSHPQLCSNHTFTANNSSTLLYYSPNHSPTLLLHSETSIDSFSIPISVLWSYSN